MIADLERTIFGATTKKELLVDQRHLDTTSILLLCFEGEDTDVFRPVHFLNNNDFFFDIHSKQYFYRVADLVREGKIRQVKRLVVYSTDDELHDPRSLRLTSFHAHTDGFAYKLMSRDDYNKILRDYHLQHTYADCGIYGEKYIYLAIASTCDEIVGVFSKDRDSIRSYIEFFEGCWNSPVAFELSDLDRREPVTLDDLFAE